jgi:hypothetical protein
MVTFSIIYIIGCWVAFFLLYLVSFYYTKYTDNPGLNLGQGLLVCLLSWILVAMLLVTYSDKYKFLLEKLFSKKKE